VDFETLQQKKEKLTFEQKVSLVEQKLGIEYSEEEKNGFNQWVKNIPESSLNSPLSISNLKEVQNLLPNYPNYRKGEKVNIFLYNENLFSDDDLTYFLKKFARQDKNFEISITRHSDKLISIGIGDKVRNSSTIIDPNGNYFGHYHPTGFGFDNPDELPDSFVLGIMPSFGDIKGYLKYVDALKSPTRIFSKYGYSKITRTGGIKELDSIELYKMGDKYINLFLGENNFGFKTDMEIAKALEKETGLKIEFHYWDKKDNE